ncbi:MAM and LDL-receptor class A domain-containing protein 1-like [Anneissia japonica]|uniref:MAM and LDL-receptor class A domain-containing protein 1-like n=1 Tax=Anneissia japonica TaxID=1529436 RepID=UPI001425AEA1|nr:MAM and LDL-receptor class A domain-containing protein 1-like [Anneissia japonica]
MDQSINDDGNWIRNSGRTNSYRTGPSKDHTLGTPQGHYVYLEATHGFGWDVKYTVRMLTPTIRSSNQVRDRCLVFWYHMYGQHIVSLNIYLSPNGETTETEVFTKTGGGVNVWKTGHVTITETLNFKIILEASSAGYRGDIAVDDISISLQKCAIAYDQSHHSPTGFTLTWSIARR